MAKLVVAEAETGALVAHLSGREVAASALVRTELRRAILRVEPRLLPQADELLERLLLVELTAELLDAAGRLEPAGPRTLDAVHIACALELGDEVGHLVTYDHRQADAADAAGLTVHAPR